MQHYIDEETKFCINCGLGKWLLLVLGNPPCGAFQLVPAEPEPPAPKSDGV